MTLIREIAHTTKETLIDRPLSTLDALTNVLAVTNFGGDSIWAEKKTMLTAKEAGPEQYPICYAVGCITGVGVELTAMLVLPIYLSYKSPWFLLGIPAYFALKAVTHGLSYLATKAYDEAFEEEAMDAYHNST